MTIHFLCPQGHHLTAPPERAGRPGQCPACGVRFRIPDRRKDVSASHQDAMPAVTDASPAYATVPHQADQAPDMPRRDSWPAIVAGLLASQQGSAQLHLILDDRTEYVVEDLLLRRSMAEVAVFVIRGKNGKDVLAIPWRRVAGCRLQDWSADPESDPSPAAPIDVSSTDRSNSISPSI